MPIKLNIYAILLILSLFQGLFFIVLMAIGRKLKTAAAVFLVALLILFAITDLDYFIIAANLSKDLSFLFGISNGLILLMGPLLYGYLRSLPDRSFRWKWKFLLHGIPYLLFLLVSLPFYTMSRQDKATLIDWFVSGRLPLRQGDYIVFSLQLLQFAAYLLLALRFARNMRDTRERLFPATGAFPPASPLPRAAALAAISLAGYLVLVLCLFGYVSVTRYYSLPANYSYSLACSLILFIMVGHALLHPAAAFGELQRRQSRGLMNGADAEHWQALIGLMETEKIYLQPEIKLNEVAERVKIRPDLLSRLVNERSGKNFSDFISHYRVEEFKSRLEDPASDQLTVLGIAFESGFNSKTSFNTLFKKFTGLTPSEYKTKIKGQRSGSGS